MQYYRSDDNRRKTTDRQAKAAAHARMRARRNRKIVWWLVILMVLGALYFTVGKSHVTPWLKGQASSVAGDVTGAAESTESLFSREELREEAEELESDRTPTEP